MSRRQQQPWQAPWLQQQTPPVPTPAPGQERQPVPVVVKPSQSMGAGETLVWLLLTFMTCGLAIPCWIWRAAQLRKVRIEYH